MKIFFFTFVLIAVLFETAADILLKSWSQSGKASILMLGIALYAVSIIPWAFSLKYEFLSKAIVVFAIFNLIVIALAGVIIFKEHLNGLAKIGIILGIISVILLQL